MNTSTPIPRPVEYDFETFLALPYLSATIDLTPREIETLAAILELAND
jgi:hypothetical protein